MKVSQLRNATLHFNQRKSVWYHVAFLLLSLDLLLVCLSFLVLQYGRLISLFFYGLSPPFPV